MTAAAAAAAHKETVIVSVTGGDRRPRIAQTVGQPVFAASGFTVRYAS